MDFGKQHDTTDFCLRQLVTDLHRETGVMDFGLKGEWRRQCEKCEKIDTLYFEDVFVFLAQKFQTTIMLKIP